MRLYGEHEYSVPPLALPDPKRPPPVERLTHYEAVRLFVERVKAAKADFSVTNENAPAVAEICVRLDGLPLAIELAAARIKVLSPQKMLERLGNRLKLLTGGARDLPERQRTLRSTIEWSYGLLDEGEKALFARLSVFAGGRTLEAIEAICDAEDDLPVDVLDGLTSLVDKSLLKQEEGVGGEPRFVMLETIHEFAREKLQESEEGEDITRLHAEYFLVLAEEASEEGLGLEGVEHFRTGSGDSIAAELQRLLGMVVGTRGELERETELLEESLALSREAGSLRGMAVSIFILGISWRARGDIERATQLLEKALTVFRETGDQALIASVLTHLGFTFVLQGDLERLRPAKKPRRCSASRSIHPTLPTPSTIWGGQPCSEATPSRPGRCI